MPHLFEYFEPPIAAALEDVAPYVRQAAVFAVAKLQAMCPQQCRQIGFAVRLQSMLYDRDAGVVINVLQALGGLLKAEDPESRGVALDKALAVHLVNRLPDFNEWGLGFVLSTLERFDWAGEGEELYAVMNAVEPCFQHANSSVVMAAASLFLKFAEKKPQLQGAILKRIRVPLITLSEGGFDELAFVLLSNVELLLQKDPSLFELDYRHFYLRHHDPQYLKEKKLQLLVAVASPRNMHDIVTELSDYVMDTCPAVGVRAIRAIAAIATKIPDAADHATHNLLTILKFDVEHLTAAVLAAFKDLLRFHRHHAARVITLAGPLALTVDDETARGSVVWILGEFGEQLPNAPYLLEVLAEEYDSQKPFVKLQLLTASLKLFFKRPPEVKPWLGALFQSSFNDSLEVNIRDRALLYWRLLSTNVQEAARIINDPKLPIPADGFPENETSELLDYLLEEFNSLSVIYHKPFSRWKPQVQYQAFHDPQESEDDHQHQQSDQPQSQSSSDSHPSV
ncbi:MAG: hypothetical protein Q8P67_19480, partial [archaeon]|nr:hypothetical protein [archaeon]